MKNDDVFGVLRRMQDLIEFQGIKIDDVNQRSILGNTPLHIAAVSGDVREGELLLKSGADPNVHGEYGNTPLHEAVGQRNYQFVKLLLAHGASKDLRNEDGFTPMDVAKVYNDELLEGLLH
jgi:ankyrin repeat protein